MQCIHPSYHKVNGKLVCTICGREYPAKTEIEFNLPPPVETKPYKAEVKRIKRPRRGWRR